MNFARLTLVFLVHKPLFTGITVLLIVVPVAILNSVMLFDFQAKKYFRRSTATIDLVLGAKGDRGELARSALLHYGMYPGNIPVKEARELVRNRVVKLAVPIIAEDQYRGHTIVGSNLNYPALFDASLFKGELWKENMDVVLGYRAAKKTGLKIGDAFFSDLGLRKSDNLHGAMAFKVTGIFKRNHNALDDIILTSTESLWLLHGTGTDTADSGLSRKSPGDYFPFDFPEGEGKELSAVLIQLRSPITSDSFLSRHNNSSGFQVVSPVAEFSRLYQSVHFSLSALSWFGLSLLIIGLLVLFVRLYYFVEEKSKDMFLLRTLGGTGMQNTRIMIFQGLIIADIGGLLGIMLSHMLIAVAGSYNEVSKVYGTSGLEFYGQEILLYLAVILLSLIISFFPAWRANHLNFWDIAPEPGF
ncbi:MAG TPA: FtsX-like permease family protein [Cyclobacteriaceae bacterium]|nr:FtsX-like permease family protein [Cyclobacteriaceae bacterium]